MALSKGAVQILTTATLVVSAAATTPDVMRRSITIRNLGPYRIYIGDSNTVTTANGFPIDSFGSLTLDKEASGAIYAIAETASQASPADTRYLVEYGVGA